MYQGNYYRMMARYNRWMNRSLYESSARLTDEQRKRDLGAFFHSVHGTLNHLLLTDKVWMARFTGGAFQAESLDQELYGDFDALRQERERMDEWILAWADELSAEWLEAPFAFRSGVDGKRRVFPGWVLASHLFNHQTHHRGQLTTLLYQLGVDPGVTDIPWLPELEAVTG